MVARTNEKLTAAAKNSRQNDRAFITFNHKRRTKLTFWSDYFVVLNLIVKIINLLNLVQYATWINLEIQ